MNVTNGLLKSKVRQQAAIRMDAEKRDETEQAVFSDPLSSLGAMSTILGSKCLLIP